MKTIFQALILACALVVTGAHAADLTTAKAQGQVGEQRDGTLGLVKNDAPADVKALVSQVNAQRKAHFADIAAKNGIAPDQAAKVFAKEAAERTLPGNYIQNDAGQWVKK